MNAIAKPARRSEYPANIPELDPDVVEYVKEWIATRRGSRRPPDVAAKVLTMIVELHNRGLFFPPRKDLATLLGTTDDSIDAAKNAALYNNEISEESRTRPSEHLDKSNRTWVTRARYYVPGPELQDVVRRAKRLKASRPKSA